MSSERQSGSPIGSTTKVLIAAVLVVLVVLASVVEAFEFGFFGVPNVVSSESRFAGVNERTTTIRTEVVLDNPNPVGLDRDNATLTHAIRMNDVPMASGTERGVSLPPGNSTRTITTYMDNGQIPEWWVTHIRRGERTRVAIATRVYSPALDDSFAIPGGRTIETDVLSSFDSNETQPVNADVPSRSGPVLFINRTSAEWGEVSGTETPIEATFVVYNPLPVSVPITGLGYTVRMNGIEVGNGSTESARVLDSGRVTPVSTTITIDATRLDEWWVTHLQRNQETAVSVSFQLQADFPVVGTIQLPVDVLTYTTELETDLLGTKNATDGQATHRAVEPSEERDRRATTTTATTTMTTNRRDRPTERGRCGVTEPLIPTGDDRTALRVLPERYTPARASCIGPGYPGAALYLHRRSVASTAARQIGS
jgi:LEA14-like dessication related protein